MNIHIAVNGILVAKFDPMLSISTYELALILPFIVAKGANFFQEFKKLPVSVQRHFVFMDEPLLKLKEDIDNFIICKKLAEEARLDHDVTKFFDDGESNEDNSKRRTGRKGKNRIPKG